MALYMSACYFLSRTRTKSAVSIRIILRVAVSLPSACSSMLFLLFRLVYIGIYAHVKFASVY